jgi:hypothetical protein
MLEDASERDAEGAFAIDLEECGYFLHAAAGEIGLILEALEQVGRITAGRICAWKRRQFISDHSGSARSATWRAKGKQANGHVTSPKRHRDAPETESETESEEERISVHVTSQADELQPREIIESWNELAQRIGKPQVRDLTDSRRQLINARIHQYSPKDFLAVLRKVERSPFLRGEGHWQGATFDWIIKRGNFQKILEGNYDRR